MEIHNGNQKQLSSNVQDNIQSVKTILNNSNDLIIRILTISDTITCAIVCISGLVNKDLLNDRVVQQIQIAKMTSDEDILFALENKVLSNLELKRAHTLDDVIDAILAGGTALIIDNVEKAIIVGSENWPGRSIEEPPTEALVRGPREGFNENIRTSVVLIRKHIRDPNLQLDYYKVGRRSRKDLVLMYVNGIVNPKIVKEVQRRIESIDLDDAPESGFIEQMIEDSFLSPFPQHLHTERPDKVSAALLQGKAAILLDGSPFALILPTTFMSLLQSPEDYYERWLIGSLIRILRFAAALISLFLPAMYIALVSFHQGMIPSKLAFSIAATREGVPFPAVIEALLMEMTLELLREAGIRLPKPIGQTIGIVGGLVIGEAAVQAGIVSPIMVIVVAVTAIASFAIPSYSAGIALRILRFITMISASIFGLYGIILVFIMINIHVLRLKSYGVPYTAPYAPAFFNDWRDMVLRAPMTMLTKRPQFLKPKEDKRSKK